MERLTVNGKNAESWDSEEVEEAEPCSVLKISTPADAGDFHPDGIRNRMKLSELRIIGIGPAAL